MELIKIVVRYIILVLCGLIQIIGVILEGISMLFGKLSDYLGILHKNLFGLVNKKERMHKQAIEDR